MLRFSHSYFSSRSVFMGIFLLVFVVECSPEAAAFPVAGTLAARCFVWLAVIMLAVVTRAFYGFRNFAPHQKSTSCLSVLSQS